MQPIEVIKKINIFPKWVNESPKPDNKAKSLEFLFIIKYADLVASQKSSEVIAMTTKDKLLTYIIHFSQQQQIHKQLRTRH